MELASGSGQHITYFAQSYPQWTFQPSDLEPEYLSSISAYIKESKLPNVLTPILIDASTSDWNLDKKYDGIWAINLIHISPWETSLGLFQQAAKHLKTHGKIYLYGPYKRDGEHTSDSNANFDQSLQKSNPKWGVRCLSKITQVANSNGFVLDQVVEMKANNLSVVFKLSCDQADLVQNTLED